MQPPGRISTVVEVALIAVWALAAGEDHDAPMIAFCVAMAMWSVWRATAGILAWNQER